MLGDRMQARGLSISSSSSFIQEERDAMVAKTVSRMAESPKLAAEEFTKFGQEQIETFGELQEEFSGLVQEANRQWLARAEQEQLMAADLTTKLSKVRSLPEIANVYQEWMIKRMEMMAEDSRRCMANGQRAI